MREPIRWILGLLLVGMSSYRAAGEEAPLLLQGPTLSRTEIVFSYGGYLWSVAREGGAARQLTTSGHESHAAFSPDGKWIAFSASYAELLAPVSNKTACTRVDLNSSLSSRSSF